MQTPADGSSFAVHPSFTEPQIKFHLFGKAGRKELQSDKKATAAFKKEVQEAKKTLK